MFGDITSMKVTRLFISSEAFTKSSCCSNRFPNKSLDVEFRLMEHDTSAEKGGSDRIQLQELAIQGEDAIDAQRQLCIREAGRKSREMKTRQVPWSVTSRALHNQLVESSLQNSVYETIEYERSMAEWTTFEQYEKIRELHTNNIALQSSLNETAKALGKATLILDRSASPV